MQLLKNAKVEGEIVFKDINLNTLQTKKMEAIRGKKISMIFQEPMSALNPSMKCGEQVKRSAVTARNFRQKMPIAK